MAITVQNAFDAITDSVKDISDISTDARLRAANSINRDFYNALVNSDPEQYVTEYTFSTSNGTATYALPAGFRTTDYGGCGVFYTTNGVLTAQMLTRTAPGSSNTGYFIRGSNIVMTPTPTNTTTYVLRYIPEVSEITDAIAGTFIVPDRYLTHIRDALMAWYTFFDKDDGRYVFQDSIYKRAIADFSETVAKSPKVIYTTDYTSAY